MFRISKFCAILLIFSAVGELFAQTPPDSKEMIKAGAETLQKLNSVGAKWNCILELPSGAEAHIETLQKGTLRLRKISLNQGLVNVVLATIIERDGYWFVEQEKSRR